jgi:hypothetical protein
VEAQLFSGGGMVKISQIYLETITGLTDPNTFLYKGKVVT